MTVRNRLFDYVQQKFLTDVYFNIGEVPEASPREKYPTPVLLQKCPGGSLADLSMVLYVNYSLTEIQTISGRATYF